MYERLTHSLIRNDYCRIHTLYEMQTCDDKVGFVHTLYEWFRTPDYINAFHTMYDRCSTYLIFRNDHYLIHTLYEMQTRNDII